MMALNWLPARSSISSMFIHAPRPSCTGLHFYQISGQILGLGKHIDKPGDHRIRQFIATGRIARRKGEMRGGNRR